MSKQLPTYDYSPLEESEPIWISDNYCILYGPEIPPPPHPINHLRLHRHSTFGTGGHPASQAAIQALNAMARSDWGAQMRSPFMEYGDTTGLLALIAAHSGCEDAYFASDEIVSHALADDNAILNGYDLNLSIASEIFGHGIVPDEMPFPDACMNVVCTQWGGHVKTLHYLPDLYSLLHKGGVLVWSGHTHKQHKAILDRIGEFFENPLVSDVRGWPCITAYKTQ